MLCLLTGLFQTLNSSDPDEISSTTRNHLLVDTSLTQLILIADTENKLQVFQQNLENEDEKKALNIKYFHGIYSAVWYVDFMNIGAILE